MSVSAFLPYKQLYWSLCHSSQKKDLGASEALPFCNMSQHEKPAGDCCPIIQCQSVNQGSLAMASASRQFGCVSCSISLLATKYFRIVYIDSRDSCWGENSLFQAKYGVHGLAQELDNTQEFVRFSSPLLWIVQYPSCLPLPHKEPSTITKFKAYPECLLYADIPLKRQCQHSLGLNFEFNNKLLNKNVMLIQNWSDFKLPLQKERFKF